MSEKNLRVSNAMKGMNNYSNQFNYRSVDMAQNSNNYANLTGLSQE